ncbi:hypothetical protein [Ornithinimicrobium cerasi]|uniref:Uncharacterized protein n=1 Tax=Ornithinimicrobium cerasi TaxID=2248773 RepID=A0A285VCS7_9MICO|nr:hypothetical protein [Ornithinimicrobium cerasi]SOC51747.1 hypothetical protein SAMN05421879_101297 [Ornithinimicrobium cerasi]
MDTGLRTRILTAIGTGTLLGVLGATGVAAFASEVEPAANVAAPGTCSEVTVGDFPQAEGRWFGLGALAAE